MQINRRPQLKLQSYLNNYTWILKSSLWPDPVHTDYLETKIARIRPVSAEHIKDTQTHTHKHYAHLEIDNFLLPLVFLKGWEII